MKNVDRRTFTLDQRGLPLAVHEWGPPAAPVLLCLHGFLDHGRSFAPLARSLGGRYRVIAPDMRGHGESGWVGAGGYYHFYDYFDDVRRVLAARAPEGPLRILGHSMGGSVATGVAALLGDRVEGMVLLEGMGPPLTDLSRTPERLRRWLRALEQSGIDGDARHRSLARRPMPDVEAAEDRLMRANPRLSRAVAQELAGSFTEPHPKEPGLVWRYDPLHRTPAAKPFVEGEAKGLWAAIQAPVLSLYGDAGMRPDDLADRHACLSALTFATLAGGHNLHHELPEVVAGAVRWLGEGLEGGAPDGLNVAAP